MARVFEVPLVPIASEEPSKAENAALAAALVAYSRRNGPDDFSALTDFLDQHPRSPWKPALLTGLAAEYYNTAHYSLALDAWMQAWEHAPQAKDSSGNAIVNHAVSELAYLYARLGRMNELEALLKSVETRSFFAGEAEKINGAREALWTMKNRPEVAFRCGPLALYRIKLATNAEHSDATAILESASTRKGISLPQVAELSKKIGLNYQMAFREKRGEFIVPAVVHWKVGHYAAMVREQGDRYLVEDPTFGNTVWPTKAALEAETSGYFLVPAGKLPPGWRTVDNAEGESVWGKGQTSNNDPDLYTCRDPQTGPCGSGVCRGMAGCSIHLMLANLQVRDTPVGYSPPVGPPVHFTVRYNSRSTIPQGFAIVSGVVGVKWSHDWLSYIHDSPQSPLSDVKCFVGGGGARTFTGFNATNQTFAFQQFDQTRLRRTSSNSYELLYSDGSKKIFAQPDGSGGSTRNIYLTQIVDASGNAVTLTYNTNLQLTAITDAIGQVTTFTYGSFLNFSITKVTDPFGRFATFDYAAKGPPTNTIYVLSRITDSLGISSEFDYFDSGEMRRMITPYGTNILTTGVGPSTNATMRYAEIAYPDGSRERVEYNQAITLYSSDPAALIPQGMRTMNTWLQYRDTYYWSRNACATGYGDYSKARVFHWCHTADMSSTSGVLESSRAPLENRVWRDYPGQNNPVVAGPSAKPMHVGRILDDGSTQLYTYAYGQFGRVTNFVDPLGREMTFIYDTNGIDLLEIRQTRNSNNELLSRRMYNAQHKPLTIVNAAGQTNIFTYNARGQLLTFTNPKGQTTVYSYDPNGYVLTVDGPLPGTNDTVAATYDGFGRVRTLTGVSGYTLTFDRDAMDRITRITYPDSTFSQFTYDLLNVASIRDRAGRSTFFDHDNMRQIRKKTDPSGRTTRVDWCSCGALKSITDPLGRKTSWLVDIQGRPLAKQYPDGSQLQYVYEKATSRLLQMIDEKQQVVQFAYNRDDSLRAVAYANSGAPIDGITLEYDPNYERLLSMADAQGTTRYSYFAITDPPALGAGKLASVDGPLSNDTLTYEYDELNRPIHRAINGIDSAVGYDAAGRIMGLTNALGSFSYAYDGPSKRLLSTTLANGLVEERSYGGDLQDHLLQRITHHLGAVPVSEFLYGRDPARHRITTWSQQADSQSPSLYTFGYDDANQLTSATVTNSGLAINDFAYTYDPSGNRLTERVASAACSTTYNALNQVSTTTGPAARRTNEWDAADRLIAVAGPGRRVEFTYDGFSHLSTIRLLTNGVQASLRRFVWAGKRICEERNEAGIVTKHFFHNGVKIEAGPDAGSYFYTRDHLGSVRELVDSNGNIRARYSYDPYGRRTRVTGDLDADFGFAGMLWVPEASLGLTHFRAYDPDQGRWLSRDPLGNAEIKQGPNLYAYVRNEPVSRIDPEGLCTGSSLCACVRSTEMMAVCTQAGILAEQAAEHADEITEVLEVEAAAPEAIHCAESFGPEFESISTDITESDIPAEPNIADVGDRIGDLAENWSESGEASYDSYLEQLNNFRDIAGEINGVGGPRPLLPQDLVTLDNIFNNLARALSNRTGLDFGEAWRVISLAVDFDPDLW
jgi:RHS repeat-associated protein